MNKQPCRQGAGATAGTAFQHSLMVLHVNDSTDDQVLFQAACQAARVPMNWHVVDSAPKALSYLKLLLEQSKQHEVCWPGLVVLDIGLPPQDQGGFEVLTFIRAQPQLQQVPVVILTGQEAPGLVKQAWRLGADGYHLKPLGFEMQVRLVRALYEKWGDSAPPARRTPRG